jgi:hypothetical protein
VNPLHRFRGYSECDEHLAEVSYLSSSV